MHPVRSIITRPLAVLGFAVVLGSLAPPANAGFSDVTILYGIGNGDRMSYAGSFVDYDGDGDHDLYATNHWESDSQLYRNDGSVPFVENTGVYAGPRDRHDSIWADFNGDGAPDQYMIHGGGQPGELLWNRGYGQFVEGADAAGIDDTDGRGREIAAADFDADGDLDLFVVNEHRVGYTHPTALFWNEGDRTFLREPNGHDLFRSRLHCSSADYDLDGYPDLVVTLPHYADGELWHNNGNGTWSEQTAAAFPGIELPLKQAQGLSWSDYDNDGDPDLLTCGGNWAMFDYAAIESDSLRFHSWCDTAEVKGLTVTTSGDSVTLSVATRDYQPVTCHFGGGDSSAVFPTTVAVADIVGEPASLMDEECAVFLWSVPGALDDTVKFEAHACSTRTLVVGGGLRASEAGIETWWSTGYAERPFSTLANWSNRLYRNEGNGTFTEVTATAFAVNDSTVNSAGAAWGDYDNDGWTDVYISNAGTIETLNEPNWLFRNNGDGTFTEVAAAEGVQGVTSGLCDGAAWGDVNGDGFLDLFVDNGGEFPPFGIGPRKLYQNLANDNHWLEVSLRGTISNPSGIGARVRVVAGGSESWAFVLGESENCYGSFVGAHVGLGAATVVDTVEVRWPSGQVDVHTGLAGDTRYHLLEGGELRLLANPALVLSEQVIVDSLSVLVSERYSIGMQNIGGAAVHYAFSTEDCIGQAAPWLSVLGEQTGGLWPASVDSFTVQVDFSGLGPGSYCGRVILSSNSVIGADTVEVTIEIDDNLVGVATGPTDSGRFWLGAPRPNPTRLGASLVLGLPAPAVVDVMVVDVRGRRSRVLHSGALPAGSHRLKWDGRDCDGHRAAPGLYFVRASCGAVQVVRKLVLID